MFEELDIHLIGGEFDGETFESDYYDADEHVFAPDHLYVWRCGRCSGLHHHLPEVVQAAERAGEEGVPPSPALYGFTRFEGDPNDRHGKAIYVLDALGVPSNSSWGERLSPGRKKELEPA